MKKRNDFGIVSRLPEERCIVLLADYRGIVCHSVWCFFLIDPGSVEHLYSCDSLTLIGYLVHDPLSPKKGGFSPRGAPL